MQFSRLISAVVLLVALVCVYNQAIGDNPTATTKAVSQDTSSCAKSAGCPKKDESCKKEWRRHCQEKADADQCSKKAKSACGTKPDGCSKKAQADADQCAKSKSACGTKPAGCSKKAQADADQCAKSKSACGTKPAGCSKKSQADADQCAKAKSPCGSKPAGCSQKAQTTALTADSCEGKDPSKCCPKTK